MLKRSIIVMSLVGCCLFGSLSASASQYFAVSQVCRGDAYSDWSFMTAWNLDTGSLQVSPNWYDDYYDWEWNESWYQDWTALFVYDVGTGQTRELKWSYVQPHVQ